MAASIITGTGAYIPGKIQSNKDFFRSNFFGETGLPLPNSIEDIVDKFTRITGISGRRYAEENVNASDIACKAALEAIQEIGADPETIDQMVVADNFGDVAFGSTQSQNVPSLACRVKNTLGIHRPECIAYDVLVGCPGWVHSLIQSHAWFRAGMAKKVLVIGTETLSRVLDISDRDSMIFADGAGACMM